MHVLGDLKILGQADSVSKSAYPTSLRTCLISRNHVKKEPTMAQSFALSFACAPTYKTKQQLLSKNIWGMKDIVEFTFK